MVFIVRDGARGVLKLTEHAKVDPNKLLMFISENPTARFTPQPGLRVGGPAQILLPVHLRVLLFALVCPFFPAVLSVPDGLR